VTFKDLGLVLRAFTHSSAGSLERANQQLEFLGDAVLGLVVASFLVAQRPDFSGREFLESRTILVNNVLLATVADELGLMRHLRVKIEEGKIPMNVVADTFEAFLAALFLDQSLAHAETLCRCCLFPHLESHGARSVIELANARAKLRVQATEMVTYEYESQNNAKTTTKSQIMFPLCGFVGSRSRVQITARGSLQQRDSAGWWSERAKGLQKRRLLISPRLKSSSGARPAAIEGDSLAFISYFFDSCMYFMITIDQEET